MAAACDVGSVCSSRDDVTRVGSGVNAPATPDSNEILLRANDILQHHCSVNKDPLTSSCSITPEQDAKLTVNNRVISSETQLQPGDVVSFGDHCTFVFRHPAQEVVSDNPTFAVEEFIRNSSLAPSPAQTNESHAPRQAPVVTSASDRTWRRTYLADDRRLKLQYALEREDDLLQTIMALNDVDAHLFALAPCFLLAMSVEHAAALHSAVRFDELLAKISRFVKNSAVVRRN